jgi:hypothetical protein
MPVAVRLGGSLILFKFSVNSSFFRFLFFLFSNSGLHHPSLKGSRPGSTVAAGKEICGTLKRHKIRGKRRLLVVSKAEESAKDQNHMGYLGCWAAKRGH